MKTLDVDARRVAAFWAKVDQRGPEECWEWTGERHGQGYGLYSEWSGNKRVVRFLAHRLSLLISGQDIDGWVVRHDCDNPPCVNPNHLRTGTQADNIHDAVSRDRVDLSGLSIGQAPVWPPRPCRRCGVIVSQGRQRYCPPCRRIVTQECHERYRAKRRLRRLATGGLTERERRKLKKATS